MSEEKHLQTRWFELIVAGLFGLVGTIVMFDSIRVGKDWGEDGPQAGYFPFYIACTLIGGALFVAYQTVRDWRADGGKDVFATYEQAGLMLKMFLPMVAYVVTVMFLGLYDASALFIAAFMVWQGKYSILRSALVGISVSVVLFLLFEIWFKVPLPKGPLEQLFGY
jgi:hypothetical protein